jgi:hypothetical protein
LNSLALDHHRQGVVFDGAGCAPLPDVWKSPRSEVCVEGNANALRYIVEHHVETVFLVARWNYYIEGGPEHIRSSLLADNDGISLSADEATSKFERHLSALATHLVQKGIHVYIVKEVPEQFTFASREAFYAAIHTGTSTITSASTEKEAAYSKRSNKAIDAIATSTAVSSIDPSQILCDSLSCSIQKNGKMLYRDENHISNAGAMLLQPLLTPIFQQMASRSQ